MYTLHSVLLGVIQGLTEFLPISSSAHLVLAPYLFNFADPGLGYDVALHMGTLLAVLGYFWKDWVEIFKDLVGKSKTKDKLAPKLLVLGTLPAMLAGLTIQKYAESALRNPLLIAGTLATFGLLLWYWDSRGKKKRELKDSNLRDAVLIGIAQACALVPGVSRSGITITMGLALGMKRAAAMRFSFLLSAPITAGAGLLKAKYIVQEISAGGPQAAAIGIGFLSSLISGLLAIGFLNALAKNKTFTGFAYYRLALSLVIVIVFIIR